MYFEMFFWYLSICNPAVIQTKPVYTFPPHLRYCASSEITIKSVVIINSVHSVVLLAAVNSVLKSTPTKANKINIQYEWRRHKN